MAFDFKKEYKEFYLPKKQPMLLTVPPMNYVAVRGSGDPNEEGGAYKQAVGILYAVAYTLRMSAKSGHAIEGFFEYVVPPLEGFWQQEGTQDIDYSDKSSFQWVSVIRLPDFITQEDFQWAVSQAETKKKMDCSAAEFLTIDEGLCAQLLHTGSYDSEPASIALLNAFIQEQGYVPDLSPARLHHEIYLSDPRKAPPEKWRTVIRHPIRKA